MNVIFLVISAIMTGDKGRQDVQAYGDAKQSWFKQYYKIRSWIWQRESQRDNIVEPVLTAL
ncbi:hypothetical protein DC889_15050 [Vibrio parahaemolyticus]|nr:hypothetical protein [Vibrio parahaemolyticus]ODX24817.1 hypothetical protein BBM00_05820 [Vibrio parahaemolyticus]